MCVLAACSLLIAARDGVQIANDVVELVELRLQRPQRVDILRRHAARRARVCGDAAFASAKRGESLLVGRRIGGDDLSSFVDATRRGGGATMPLVSNRTRGEAPLMARGLRVEHLQPTAIAAIAMSAGYLVAACEAPKPTAAIVEVRWLSVAAGGRWQRLPTLGDAQTSRPLVAMPSWRGRRLRRGRRRGRPCCRRRRGGLIVFGRVFGR